MNKSSVSLLQEYCAKNYLPSPDYIIITEDTGFACKVELGDQSAVGKGRSKRNAKHESAHNLLLKMRIIDSSGHITTNSIDPVAPPQSKLIEDTTTCTTDLVKELRDKCVRYEIPLPEFAIIQQTGTPDAPNFVSRCKVASIVRYGVSDKKKDARQQAAKRLLDIITSISYVSEENLKAMVPSNLSNDVDYNAMWYELESKRRKVVKSYYELTETGETSTGIKLADTHMYFTRFHEHLKKNALQIIVSDVLDDEAKVNGIFKILHIQPLITEMTAPCDSKTKTTTTTTTTTTITETMLYIKLNVDIDCAFFNYKSKIFNNIIRYFRTMLV